MRGEGTEMLIRNISDTALLAAVYRARETERSDPLFRVDLPEITDYLARTPASDAKENGQTPGGRCGPFKFAAVEGPDLFRKFGWKPVGVRSMFHAAGQMKRLPLGMSFFYHLQKAEDFQTKRPWAGTCLLEREVNNLEGHRPGW